MANQAVARDYSQQKAFRALFPSWDNTARRGPKAVVALNATRLSYEHWLNSACRQTEEDRAPEERLVFIDTWNEWAEGGHLEPDRRYGRGSLEATLRVKKRTSNTTGYRDTALPAIDKPKCPFMRKLRHLIAPRALPWLGYGRR